MEEKINIEELIKELKEELLNKEMTLLDLDNDAQRITGSTASLFDAENDCIEQTSCAYFIYDNKYIGPKNIIIEFEIIDKNEDNLNTIIKVTDIWED